MHELIARLHPHAPRQTPIDFQNKLDPRAAVNRRQILRNGIFMDPRDVTRFIGKQHIQRNKRVFHPKLGIFGPIKHEQHPRSTGHMGAVHQAQLLLFWAVRDFDRKTKGRGFGCDFNPIWGAGCLGGGCDQR